jgi:hypothetical protein
VPCSGSPIAIDANAQKLSEGSATRRT